MTVATFRKALPFLLTSAVAAAFSGLAFQVSFDMGFLLAGLAVFAFYEGVII